MDSVLLLVPPERRREAAVLTWLVLEGGSSGGLYVLCGPPGCGKSLVLEALLAGCTAPSSVTSEALPKPVVVAARCLRPAAAAPALCAALTRTNPGAACPAPAGSCRTSRDIAAHVQVASSNPSATATSSMRLLVLLDLGATPLGPADEASWAALAAWPRLFAVHGAACSVVVAARTCPPDVAALHAPTVLPLAPYTRSQCVSVAARLYVPRTGPASSALGTPRAAAAYLDLLARLFLAERVPAVRTLLRLALAHEGLYTACLSRALASAGPQPDPAARARALLAGRARFTDLCARRAAAAPARTGPALLAALPVKALHTLIACYLAAHTRAPQDFAFQRLDGGSNNTSSSGTNSDNGANKDTSKGEEKSATKPKHVPRRATRLQVTTVLPNARGFPLRRALFIQRHLFGCHASCAARDGGAGDAEGLAPGERLAVLEDDAAVHDFFGAVRELTRRALLRPLPSPTLAQQLLVADSLAQRYECLAPRTLVHAAAAALVPPLSLDEFISPGC